MRPNPLPLMEIDAYICLRSMSQGKIGVWPPKSCTGTSLVGVLSDHLTPYWSWEKEALKALLHTVSLVDQVVTQDVGDTMVQISSSPEGEKRVDQGLATL